MMKEQVQETIDLFVQGAVNAHTKKVHKRLYKLLDEAKENDKTKAELTAKCCQYEMMEFTLNKIENENKELVFGLIKLIKLID